MILRQPRPGESHAAHVCLLVPMFAAASMLIMLSQSLYAGVCSNTTTVTNTSDSAAVSGSLRWAVTEVNSCTGPGTIEFDISGPGPHRITMESPISITDTVNIDGFSQPSASPNSNEIFEADNADQRIELRADTGVAIGLGLLCDSENDASGSVIRGLVINAFDTVQILNEGCDNVEISGNHIGTDVSGMGALAGSSFGVLVRNASENLIGGPLPAQRNIIAGHESTNVVILGDSSDPDQLATGNTIRNNFIGTSADGSRPIVANSQVSGVGISVVGEGAIPDAGNALVNRIEDNLVSGHSSYGIDLVDSTGTLIWFNALGTDSTISPTMEALREETPLPPPPPAIPSMGNGLAGIRIGNAEGRLEVTPVDDRPSTDNNLLGNAIHNGGASGVLLESGEHNLLLANSIYNSAQNGISAVETACPGGITCANPSGRWARNIVTQSGSLDVDVKAAGPGPVGISIDSVENNGYSGQILEGIGLGCRIEFFANDACDPSGQGEMQYFIGLQDYAACPSVFSHSPGTPPYPGPAITATLTYFVPGGGSPDAAISTESSMCISNVAPVLDSPIPDQTADEDEAFAYQVPAETFSDPNGDVLSYSATLSGGSPLPAWLGFNGANRTFSGTPLNQDVDTIEIEVTATDTSGPASASDIFQLVVINTNDPPTAADDFIETPNDVPILISVLANDQDPDLIHGDSLSLVSVQQPAEGSAEIEGPQILYSPQVGFTGSDQFEYIMQDVSGAQSSATVFVEVLDILFKQGFESP